MKMIKHVISSTLKIGLILITLNAIIDSCYFIRDYLNNEYSFSISGFNFNKEAVFVNGEKTIVLIGMTHIANKEFYERLRNRFKDKNAVTLSEGVSDRSGYLKGFGYATMARLIGLSSQPNAKKLFPNVKNADGDVSAIKKSEIESISILFKNVKQIDEAIAYPKNKPYQKFIIDMRKSNDFNFRNSEVLLSRNVNLIKRVDLEIAHNNYIIIPWGALHLNEISSNLLKKGFKPKEVRFNYTHSSIGVMAKYVEWACYLYLKSNIGFAVIN